MLLGVETSINDFLWLLSWFLHKWRRSVTENNLTFWLNAPAVIRAKVIFRAQVGNRDNLPFNKGLVALSKYENHVFVNRLQFLRKIW